MLRLICPIVLSNTQVITIGLIVFQPLLSVHSHSFERHSSVNTQTVSLLLSKCIIVGNHMLRLICPIVLSNTQVITIGLIVFQPLLSVHSHSFERHSSVNTQTV